MNTSKLPIAVVIPTLNVRGALPPHLEHMRPWLDLVEEVVVVDSQSNDGTFEYLQANLGHARTQYLQHPPGLYPSWNHGIRHVSARYSYISTIGDTITRDGLRHLSETATALGADIVVSRPAFLDRDNRPVTSEKWPIHRLLECCPITRPAALENWQSFLLSALDAPQGMMGSSASNLYATAALQRTAFPSDYGHAGDTAWGIMSAFRNTLAITPEVFSHFVIHPNANSKMTPERHWSLLRRFRDLALATLAEAMKDPSTTPAARELLKLTCDVLLGKFQTDDFRESYYAARREIWPWFVNPRAWKARAQRNEHRRALADTTRGLARYLETNISALANDASPFSAAVTRYLGDRVRMLCN